MEHHSTRGNGLHPLVCRTFAQVYQEFFDWESRYCSETLQTLRRPCTSKPHSLDVQAFEPSYVLEDVLESFQVEEFLDDNTIQTTTRAENIYIDAKLEAYPRYEICTPVVRSLMVGDDPDSMPYIPFSDDPSFRSKHGVAYNNEHKSYAWQAPGRDPDVEIIAIETVQRLLKLEDPPVSIHDNLDRLGIFHLGFNWKDFAAMARSSQRRDYPPLPPAWVTPLPCAPPYAGAGPKDNLTSLIRAFCNNSNCLTGYCVVHIDEADAPLPVVPKSSASNISHSVEKRCGKNCFVLGRSTRAISDVWSESDAQLLLVLLNSAPDALPCDLAVICRKPCYEVAKFRSKYLAKERTTKSDRTTTIRTNSHRQSLVGITGLAMPIQNARVTTIIRIVLLHVAVLRVAQYAGRLAIVHQRPRNAARAAARAISRIVNVILSLASVARQDGSSGMCHNVSIQRGHHKATEVRPTKWGLGLFILEDAEEEDLILEYTGEVILEPTTKSRDHVSSHRQRGYLFALNKTQSIDSSFTGNESRYINHDPNPNCESHVRLVNGEHRIGVFASKPLKKGMEILIDYGPEFFQDRDQPAEDPNLLQTQDASSDSTYSDPSSPKENESHASPP